MSTATATPYAPSPLTLNPEVGESQRAFAEQVHADYEAALASGTCHPFTLINFNPVSLDMTGVLKRYRIPSPGDERLPADVMRVKLEFDGRERRGHALTIRYPMKDGKMLDAKSSSTSTPGEPIVSRGPKLYWPKEVAYKIMERYSPIFPALSAQGVIQPPPPKDARRIYGVLAFEGDIHTLEKILEEEDEAKRIINVPICHMRTVGKQSIANYQTIPYSFDLYLKQMFEGQRKFADAVIMKAQQRFDSDDELERRNIQESDRVWYRWAIAMRYKQRPDPSKPTWLTEFMNPDVVQVASNLRKCPGCKSVEPEPDTPFCQKCNRPMDTFKTFMAGHPVPDAYLHTLEGEEREIVIAELKRRREGFDSPAAPVVEAAKGKGGRKKTDPVNDEVAAAASTELPGDEA